MSYDFAVWHTIFRLTNEDAQDLYLRLSRGVTGGVTPHPSVGEFYAELTATHPELNDVPRERRDDIDYCPWSVPISRSPGHLIVSYVWSKEEYVRGLIRTLARKYGLPVFDSRSGIISYQDARKAPQESSSASRGQWWKDWPASLRGHVSRLKWVGQGSNPEATP